MRGTQRLKNMLASLRPGYAAKVSEGVAIYEAHLREQQALIDRSQDEVNALRRAAQKISDPANKRRELGDLDKRDARLAQRRIDLAFAKDFAREMRKNVEK